MKPNAARIKCIAKNSTEKTRISAKSGMASAKRCASKEEKIAESLRKGAADADVNFHF